MDINKIEELIKVLQGSQTQELSVRAGDSTVTIRKGQFPSKTSASSKKSAARAQAPVDAQPEATEHVIRAPMVGIFHPANGLPVAGAQVKAGQVVGAIESMKLLNDVISDVSGTISEVLVEEGTPVEYGQPLCALARE